MSGGYGATISYACVGKGKIMEFTQEKRDELIRKFVKMLIEDGQLDEQGLCLLGTFSFALQCVIDADLMDKSVESARLRREKGKAA